MADSLKPFLCNDSGCEPSFSTDDHMDSSRQRHQMSEMLTPNTLNKYLFSDQTPTPTMFLRGCEDMGGLFTDSDLTSRNPFDEAFKEAAEKNSIGSTPLSETSLLSVQDTLNTPTPNLHTPLVQVDVEPVKKRYRFDPFTALDQDDDAHVLSLDTDPQSEDIVSQLPGSLSSSLPASQLLTSSSTGSDCPSIDLAEISQITPAGSGQIDFQRLVSMLTSSQHNRSISEVLSQPIYTSVTASSTTVPPIDLSHVINIQPSNTHTPLQILARTPTGQLVPIQVQGPSTSLVSPLRALSTQQGGVTVVPVSIMNSMLASRQFRGQQAPLNVKQILKQSIQHNSQLAVGAIGLDADHMSSSLSPGSMSPGDTAVQIQAVDSSYSSAQGYSQLLNRSSRTTSQSDSDEKDEKRKHFLERNKAAAARCRAKKKQWMSELQQNCDEFQRSNAKLQKEVLALKKQVADLQSLMLAHKDCPVAREQERAGKLSFQSVFVNPRQQGSVNHQHQSSTAVPATSFQSTVPQANAVPTTTLTAEQLLALLSGNAQFVTNLQNQQPAYQRVVNEVPQVVMVDPDKTRARPVKITARAEFAAANNGQPGYMILPASQAELLLSNQASNFRQAGQSGLNIDWLMKIDKQ